MDKQIDVQFERVEKALSALVDSIAKYNPSVNAANHLASAERGLSQGLEEVQIHQNNHLKIQQLRAATASLDGQILDTLKVLAITRKELKSTPETKFVLTGGGPEPGAGGKDDSHSFTFAELLSYARRISKMTLPFAGASLQAMGLDNDGNPLPVTPEESGQQEQPQQQQQQQKQPNGVPVRSHSQPQQSDVSAGVTPAALTPTVGSGGTGEQQEHSTALPEYFHMKANPRLNSLFTPFPDQNKILSGALVATQLLSESGIDPKNYDPAAEAEKKVREEEERAAHVERERLEREEENKRIRHEREEQLIRRAKDIQQARQKQDEEEARLRVDSSSAVAGADATSSSSVAGTGPVPLATSPVVEKKNKGEFQFMADLDDED